MTHCPYKDCASPCYAFASSQDATVEEYACFLCRRFVARIDLTGEPQDQPDQQTPKRPERQPNQLI